MLLPIFMLLAVRIEPTDVAVPYRQPQLAAGHGQVAMVFGGGSGIYFAHSPDQGRTFAAPVKVADVGALMLGRHRGPRLAILKNALVITAMVGEIKGPTPHPDSGNLITWRSTDRGLTWKRGGTVNDIPTSAREGLHAMAASPDSSIFAAWLDLRQKGTRLYGARSTDGGLTWQKNLQIYESPDGTICQCCHPTLTFDESGRVFAMWRNALDGSRDIYFTTSSDGQRFAPAQKLGQGTWKLNACPMDGGALAVEKGKVFTAWRRDGEIFVAEPGQAEQKVGAGKDVSLARSKRGTYLAWSHQASLQLLTPKATAPTELTPVGAFVALLALPDGAVLAAWEAKGSVETKRLD